MTDNTIEFIKVTNKKNSSNGSFKHHSSDKLAIIWLFAVGFVIISTIAHKSALSITLSAMSLASLFYGIYMYNKTDYRWYLYYCCNALGLWLCISNIFFFDSIEALGTAVSVVVIFLSICLGIGISYTDTIHKIRKNRDGSSDINTAKVLIIIGCAVGTSITKLVPDRVEALILSAGGGLAIALYVTPIVCMYYYGKKYDPNCEFIKKTQAESEEK